MRICLGILATAGVLFAAGAVGLLGTWALATGAVIGLLGAVSVAVVMEDRNAFEVTPIPSAMPLER